jgi:CubicO group peptidase (beta-lactamase class C family)
MLVISLLVLITLDSNLAFIQEGNKNVSDLEDEVDAYVQPYLDLGGFHGVILIAKDGKILLNKAYGMASYEYDVPNTPQTKFQIASISKSFTASAILILQERGKLSVQDPLNRFISDYPNGDRITINHLLTHSSGIPNVNEFPDYDYKARFPQNLEQIIDMFKDKPLNFKPGEKYSYSNSNYNLLAFIIEKVSGMSYGEFLRENIFQPLEMKDTAHHGDASTVIKNIASGYVPSGSSGPEKAPYLDWSIKTGNGSVYSTAEDLYKWDRALYTEKILKKNTLDEMFKEHLEGIGYGWFVRKRLNRRVTAYNGRSPGFTSCLERYIDDNACIVILSNNYTPAPHMMIEGLSAILFGEEYEKMEAPQCEKLDPEILDSYVGRYQFGSDFYRQNAEVQIVKKNDYLIFQWTETYISPLKTLTETKFLDLYFWAYIIFEKDTDGNVTRLIWRDTDDFPAKRLKE